jgi:hypothetical protein
LDKIRPRAPLFIRRDVRKPSDDGFLLSHYINTVIDFSRKAWISLLWRSGLQRAEVRSQEFTQDLLSSSWIQISRGLNTQHKHTFIHLIVVFFIFRINQRQCSCQT